MRLRLLPLLIVAAAALFTVKIGDIWQGISTATAAKAGLVQIAAKPPEDESAGVSAEGQAEPDADQVAEAAMSSEDKAVPGDQAAVSPAES